MHLTIDVNFMDADFEESAHPRGKGGQFSSTPGGKTDYSHSTTGTSNAGFAKARKTAHEHAAFLRESGHEDVKVTKRFATHTIPGKGVGATGTWTVHHGQPKAASGS